MAVSCCTPRFYKQLLGRANFIKLKDTNMVYCDIIKKLDPQIFWENSASCMVLTAQNKLATRMSMSSWYTVKSMVYIIIAHFLWGCFHTLLNGLLHFNIAGAFSVSEPHCHWWHAFASQHSLLFSLRLVIFVTRLFLICYISCSAACLYLNMGKHCNRMCMFIYFEHTQNWTVHRKQLLDSG